jgi:hypothetical protein
MHNEIDENWIYDLEEKALFGRGKRSGRKVRKILKRPKYDGDADGFITNPLTGRDEIPWFKDRGESAEDAIKRFFGGKLPRGISGDMLDDRKTPFKGKAKVSQLKRGDVLPDGFDKGIDRGTGTEYQVVKISKLGNGQTRLHVVDLADPKRVAKPMDIPDLLEIPNVKRPPAAPMTRGSLLSPTSSSPKKTPTGTNFGPYDLRPEDRQKFPGITPTAQKPTTPAQPAESAKPDKIAYTWPKGDNGFLKPVDSMSDGELTEAKKFFDGLAQGDSSKPAVSKMASMVNDEVNKRKIAKADSAWRWPKDENGRDLEILNLTDSQLDDAIAAMQKFADEGSLQGGLRYVQYALNKERDSRRSSANQAELAEDIRLQNIIRRAEIREYEDARRSMWDKFKQWVPHRIWKGGRDESYFDTGKEAFDRWRTDNLKVDIVQSDDDPDKFALVGHIYDPATGEWVSDFWDGYGGEQGNFDSVEDAMKYIEDLEDLLDDPATEDFDVYDADFPWPEENVISKNMPQEDGPSGKDWKTPVGTNEPSRSGKTRGKLLGTRSRTHNYIPEALTNARDWFKDRWNDRRTNANLGDRISFAKDRRLELARLNEQLFKEWEDYFGGFDVMEKAWYSSADFFAKWALENNLVDSRSEGITRHEEIMDGWDQLGADQQELAEMLDGIDNEIDRLKKQWDDKHSRNVPGFEETFDEWQKSNPWM